MAASELNKHTYMIENLKSPNFLAYISLATGPSILKVRVYLGALQLQKK